MIRILAIGSGGFLGALLRYWMTGWVYALGKSDFPAGTLVVNVLGAFLLGAVLGISESRHLPSDIHLFLTIGLLGGFTTFSTFSYETVALLQLGSYLRALINIVASLGLAFAGVIFGLILGRAL